MWTLGAPCIAALVVSCALGRGVALRDLDGRPAVSLEWPIVTLVVPYPRMEGARWVRVVGRRANHDLIVRGVYTLQETSWSTRIDLREHGFDEADVGSIAVFWRDPDGRLVEIEAAALRR